jgi:dihydrofolate synthase / folylpolyglutamate synthase
VLKANPWVGLFFFKKGAIVFFMQCIPIKTRILLPPQDNLFSVLDESLQIVQEGDVIAVSSKVVAISEGNCVLIGSVEKSSLIEEEAELLIPRSYWPSPLTVKHHAFIGTAGIDESNANGYYILLPRDPFKSAQEIYTYLKQRFGLTRVGVIITDSHSAPLRRGALGVSIGYAGFAPTINYVGTPDLFGREMKIEVGNVVDALAAAAGVVMGETNECQPITLIRDIPNITFTEEETKDDFLVSFEDDTFRVLYERFLT